MRQAISTKFLGPTNSRGARVKASCQAGSTTVEWDHALNPAGNHVRAAKQLAAHWGWRGDWYGGANPNNSGYTFVLVAGGADFNIEEETE